jgi:putative oxidoreductase
MMATTSPDSTTYGASMPVARPRFAACVGWLERMPFSLHLLLFRLAIAGVFLRAGLQKLASWESTVALFAEEYKVPVLPPAIAAAMGSAVEVGCSMLLLLGLGTRLAALPMLGQILVIQLFVYPGAWPEHLVWSSILLVLLTRGGGALSLDHLVWGRRS